MKKLVVMMLCISIVACAGSDKKENKSDAKSDTPVAQTIGGEKVSEEGSERLDGSTVDAICQMAEDYQEMAISALENGDAQTFMATMERRETWLNGLSEEDRVWADAAIEKWDIENAERKEQVKEKALTMPRMAPENLESAR
jgi:hypothetical protein